MKNYFYNCKSLIHTLFFEMGNIKIRTLSFTKSRINPRLFALLLFFVGMGGVAQGQILLTWNTYGNIGTETTEPSVSNDANIAAASLTLGAGVTPTANANRFGGSNWWKTGNSNPNTIAEAVTANSYIQFIVTPNAGYSFTPTSFVFNWDNSPTGPYNVSLRSSVDGYTTDLGTVAPVASIGTSNTITISGLSNITTATTFRVYGYGATAAGGTGGFDIGSSKVNVQLNGTTAAVTPILTRSPATLTGFTYAETSGPSPSQSFTLTGSNLTPASGNITIDASSTDYEVSLDNSSFASSKLRSYTLGTLSTTIYVRLKAGKAKGNYNSQTINISGGGATALTIVASGNVTNERYTTIANGDWNTAGTWDKGVPGSGKDVIINHAVTSTAAITRDAGTTTTVSSGASLTMSAQYNNNGTTTVSTGATLAMTGANFMNNSVANINGTFQLNNGSWGGGTTAFTYGAAGTLIFNTSGNYDVNNDPYWPSPTGGPVNVTVQNSGGITMKTPRTVTGIFQTSIGVRMDAAGRLTMSGTCQINGGGYFDTYSPVYGSSSTLIYNSGGTYGVGTEWTGNATTAGTGVPQNVTIQNSTTVTTPTTSRGLAGNLTITSGGLTLNATSGDLYVGGNWERAASGTTFTPNNRAVFFNGNKTQTVNGSGHAAEIFEYLIVGVSAGTTTLQLGGDVTVKATNTGNVLTFITANDVVDINGRTLILGSYGNASAISGSGSFKGSTTSNLTLAGSGLIGTIKFTSNLNLGTLTLYKTSNGGFTLGSALTINTSLVFTSGVLTLDSYDLTFASGASVGGTPAALSMIETIGTGKVVKMYTTTGSFTFPLGNTVPTNNRIYTPATFNFTAGTFGGSASVAVNVKPVEQTFTTRSVTATAYLKRYWNVSTTNITAYYCTASFLYNIASPTDVGTVGAGTEANLKIAGWNSTDGGWVMGGLTNTTTHTLSVTTAALQDAYTGGDAFPLMSNYSDYFRTKSGGSGNWDNKNNWETSPDNSSWYPATKTPQGGAASITILNPLTLNIAKTLDNLTINNGGVLTHSVGNILTINNGAFTINSGGIYSINGRMPVFTGTGNMVINSGGIVRADVLTTPNESDDIAYSNTIPVVFKTGSIFDWNVASSFESSGKTYFPNDPTQKPIFRISKTPGTPGAGVANPTTFNGILDVNANVTFISGGAKNFRDGITGSATITQDATCGSFNITAAGAILGGSSLGIVLSSPFNLSTTTSVPVGGNVTISGANINNSGGTFTIDGTLDVTTIQITNPSSTVNVNGTFKTANTGGFTGSGSSIPSGTVNIGSSSTVEYYATASQAITTAGTTYGSITFKGGIKTFTNAINTSTTGTVTISGSSVYLDASSNNLGLTGANTTNFIMDGGTLILGTGGTQPNMDGTYTITGGLIKYTSASPQTIRPRAYKNIEIYSANVSSGLGFVRLTTNGTFTIKSGGVYANSNYSIMADGATTGQHVIVESGGKITSNRDGGFYGGSGTVYSAIHSNIAAGNISLDPNSTVELNASGDQTNILDGVTFGHLILSGTGQKIFYGTVNVKGNITNNANFTLNSTTKGFLYLSGTGDQTISGSGNFYLYTMELNKSSGKVLLQQTINQIDDHLSFTNGQLDIGTGVSLNLSDGAGITLGSGDFASSSLGNVVFKGTSLIDGNGTNTINFYPNVYLTPTGAKGVNFGAKSMVYKLLQLDAGSFVNTNAPTYASTSTLKYNIGASYNRSVEWSQITGNGYPYNVQISGNTELNPTRSDGTFQSTDFKIAGNLTIDNGSSIRMDYGVGVSGTGMLKPLIVLGDLQINGELRASIQAPGDIELNGNWTRGSTGVFYPNDRSVSFLGSSNTSITVSATEHKETFPYLIVNKGTLSTQLSLNDSITITKKFTFSKGTLQLKEADVTFQSTNDNTASLTALNASNTAIAYTGGTATGRFIVERYLPNHWAWHFFSVPTKGSTFNSAWQEGNQPGSGLDPLKNKKPGFGTILTSPLGTSKGFDSISPQPSIKYFNKDSARYFPISRTDSLMDNLGGYMVFVRGDRSVSPNYGTSTSTTLRTRGKIYEPGAVADTIKMGKDSFALVGNPYPSAIDFDACDTFNLDASYYVWDPNLTTGYGYGAFQTISAGSVTPGGGGYTGVGPFYIQSGQSFFVKAEADDSARIFIPETAKVDGSKVSVFRTGTQKVNGLAPASATLRAQLFRIFSGQPILIDGVVSLFNEDYDNQIDKWDAIKLTNLNSENMGVRSNGKVLAIERKDLPHDGDTIFYKMNNYKIAPYRFLFIADKLDVSGQDAFLYDKYLNTFTPVSPNDTTVYDFTITNATGSWDETRFSVVFKNSKTTPVTLTNLKAYTQNKDIVVEWKVENESNMRSYTVETTIDGKTFIKGGTVAAKNVSATTYQWLDANVIAGYHYYRILSTELDGKSSYSKIVRVLVGNNSNASKITIYPNPIKDGVINLQFENQEAGIYQLRLLNTVGQVMMTKTITHPGGNSSELLMLNSTIARGIYNLEITKGNVRVMGEKVVF